MNGNLLIIFCSILIVFISIEQNKKDELVKGCLQEVPRGSEVSLVRTDSIGYVEEVAVQGQNNQCEYKVRVRGSNNMIDYKYKNKSHLQIIEKHK